VAFLAAAEGAAVAEGAGATATAGRAGASGAGKAAGKRAPRKSAAAPAGGRRQPRNLNDLPPEEREAELQARRSAAARKSGSTPGTRPEHIPTSEEVANGVTSEQLENEDRARQPAKSSGPLFQLPPASPVHTGGGVVLGVIGWAFARAYLKGGLGGMKALAKAKFLNQVEG
jgi:hypothetical protein